jgi:hypothetical protein
MFNIIWNFFSTTNIVEESQDYSKVYLLTACLTGATVLELFFRYRHDESFFCSFFQSKIKIEPELIQHENRQPPSTPSTCEKNYASARRAAHFQKCKKCQSGD